VKNVGLGVYGGYQYVFDSSKNPLRDIPDPTSRMFTRWTVGHCCLVAFESVGVFFIGLSIYSGLVLSAIVLSALFLFLAVSNAEQ
jgi:hypothetical protein